LQLAQGDKKVLGGSWLCIKKIVREEGIKGFYKGLSASYLGVTEGTIQWVLYEKLKRLSVKTEGQGAISQWMGMLGSAGTAKFVASLITYPHEVRIPRIFTSWTWRNFYYLGPTDTTASATRKRCPEIHRSMANPPASHRRRGRTITVRRSQRASDACGTQRCCDVLNIRRLHYLGRESLRLEQLDVIAASSLPSIGLVPDPMLSASHPDGTAPPLCPPLLLCKNGFCVDVSCPPSLLCLSITTLTTRPNPQQVLYYQCPTQIPALAPVSSLQKKLINSSRAI
jgi:hypothetical protein